LSALGELEHNWEAHPAANDLAAETGRPEARSRDQPTRGHRKLGMRCIQHPDGAGFSTSARVNDEFGQCLTGDPAFPRHLRVGHRIDGLQDGLAIDAVGGKDATIGRRNRWPACPEIKRKNDRHPHR